jgi:hypothetical protein
LVSTKRVQESQSRGYLEFCLRGSVFYMGHVRCGIGRTCVIIHNMIVSQRREKYKGTQNVRLPDDDMRMPTEVRLIRGPQNRNEQAQFWREHVDGCEDFEQHC